MNSCLLKVFARENHQELCDWLSRFVTEVHKADDTEYTPQRLRLKKECFLIDKQYKFLISVSHN